MVKTCCCCLDLEKGSCAIGIFGIIYGVVMIICNILVENGAFYTFGTVPLLRSHDKVVPDPKEEYLEDEHPFDERTPSPFEERRYPEDSAVFLVFSWTLYIPHGLTILVSIPLIIGATLRNRFALCIWLVVIVFINAYYVVAVIVCWVLFTNILAGIYTVLILKPLLDAYFFIVVASLHHEIMDDERDRYDLQGVT